MRLLALFPILVSTITKVQAICYTSGDEWGIDKIQANDALEEVCSHIADLGYGYGEVRYFCVNADSGEKKLEFWIRNAAKISHFLDKTVCVQSLGDEINGCSLGGASLWMPFGFRCVYVQSCNRRGNGCNATNSRCDLGPIPTRGGVE